MRAAAAANVCHPNDGPGPAPAPMTESGRAAGQQSKARGAFLIPTSGSHSQAGLTNRCGQIFQLMGTRLSVAPSEKKTHELQSQQSFPFTIGPNTSDPLLQSVSAVNDGIVLQQ